MWLRSLQVVALVQLIAACGGEKRAPQVSQMDARPLAATEHDAGLVPVEFAGCSTVERGPICILGLARGLLLWTSGTEPLRASSEAGAEIALAAEAVLGGTRYTLTVPEQAHALRVFRSTGQVMLTLPLRAASEAPEPLVHARALRESGEFSKARALLESFVAERRRADDHAQVDAGLSLLARISMGEGHDEQALSEFQASLERSVASGRISDAMLDVGGIVHLSLKKLQRPSTARDALARVSRLVKEDPSSSAILAYNEGLVALGTGDYRTALDASRDAYQRLARLGNVRYAQFAREQEAVTLGWLGRYFEAIALQRQVVDQYTSADPCQLVDRQDGIVWMAQRGDLQPHNELGSLARTYAALAETTIPRCEAPFSQRNHALVMLELALRFGELENATRKLQRLREIRGGSTPELETMEHEMRARYALARGQHALAQRSFTQARDLSRQHSLWESEYLALIGLARSSARQPERAIQAYREAEHLLTDVLDTVPLSEGRAGFSSARAAGTRCSTRLKRCWITEQEACVTRTGTVSPSARS